MSIIFISLPFVCGLCGQNVHRVTPKFVSHHLYDDKIVNSCDACIKYASHYNEMFPENKVVIRDPLPGEITAFRVLTDLLLNALFIP